MRSLFVSCYRHHSLCHAHLKCNIWCISQRKLIQGDSICIWGLPFSFPVSLLFLLSYRGTHSSLDWKPASIVFRILLIVSQAFTSIRFDNAFSLYKWYSLSLVYVYPLYSEFEQLNTLFINFYLLILRNLQMFKSCFVFFYEPYVFYSQGISRSLY